MIGAAELALMNRAAGWSISGGARWWTPAHWSAPCVPAGWVVRSWTSPTPEPPPDYRPLWTGPQAVITPHSDNSESLLLKELASRVRDNTERFVAGLPLPGMIDPRVGYWPPLCTEGPRPGIEWVSRGVRGGSLP
jgi:hypothetical protein